MPLNEFGQPVGETVDWRPGPALEPTELVGTSCRLVPLAAVPVEGLYDALCVRSPPETWTYMASGPFEDLPAFTAYVEGLLAAPATVALAVLLPDGTPVGIATWLRIDRAAGTAEVGGITYAVALQRTRAATEAMVLMAEHAFDVAGVRRYEWKCDALNEPSRRAALRMGFTFEGVFRQALVYKGRNRDTAWFAITDADWPHVRARLRTWLDPANFDVRGVQLTALGR